MPRYLRPRIAGASCFFTVVSYRRRPICCTPLFRQALRNAIQHVRAEHPFTINAWVLLPDHLHCLWTLPADDSDYSLRWNLIKRLTTQACAGHFDLTETQFPSRTRRRESTIWQRRFWEHQIRDEADLHRHMDYLHMNPVKHGYCTQASAWPYSSLHRLIAEGLYPADWAIAAADTCPNISEPDGSKTSRYGA